MRAYLTVSLRTDFDEQFNVRLDVSHAFREVLQPVDVCFDAMSAMLSNGHSVSVPGYQRVKLDRERAARYVADAVTKQLLDYVESRDTEQGYTKAER